MDRCAILPKDGMTNIRCLQQFVNSRNSLVNPIAARVEIRVRHPKLTARHDGSWVFPMLVQSQAWNLQWVLRDEGVAGAHPPERDVVLGGMSRAAAAACNQPAVALPIDQARIEILDLVTLREFVKSAWPWRLINDRRRGQVGQIEDAGRHCIEKCAW